MIHKGILICSIIFFTALGCKESRAQEQGRDISAIEMQKIIETENVQIIDVRTPKEFAEGYIKNAENIDFMASGFSTKINALDKQKPVLIYCRSGRRSAESVNVFLKAGFTKIYDLKGGILEWNAEKLPIEIDK